MIHALYHDFEPENMSRTEDFHKKPFDEGTMVKLRLLENYIREWLPVFLPSAKRRRINMVDFFAGPGRDVNDVDGSPLIALRQIRKFAIQIRRGRGPLYLLLNEKSTTKTASLRRVMENQKVPEELCRWRVTALDFEEAFDSYYPDLRDSANLLFFDQTGIKFISDDVFSRIVMLPTTDFMFFIASSSLRRFGQHPHFLRHLQIPKGSISARKFNDTHRAVTDYYRGLVPPGKDFYLGSFSIKKGSNLYGIIFGSAHPRGIEKFLRVCWKEDPVRGEANFDIDAEDIDPQARHLFTEMDRPKKIDRFEQELKQAVLTNELKTDSETYLFALRRGFLPSHARKVLAQMLGENVIAMLSPGIRPRVSLVGYKEPRSFKVIRNGDV